MTMGHNDNMSKSSEPSSLYQTSAFLTYLFNIILEILGQILKFQSNCMNLDQIMKCPTKIAKIYRSLNKITPKWSVIARSQLITPHLKWTPLKPTMRTVTSLYAWWASTPRSTRPPDESAYRKICPFWSCTHGQPL